MLIGETAWSIGYWMAGVRAGSDPAVAPENSPAAPAGVPVPTTTLPVRFTTSSALPLWLPQVAVTAVLPPCAPTVRVGPENDPNVESTVRMHDDVRSVLVPPATPNTWYDCVAVP